MRETGVFFLYLFACLVLGALLTYPLLQTGWIAYDPHRVMGRLAQIFILLGLWPFLKAMRLNDHQALGYAVSRPRFLNALWRGWLLGAALLSVLVLTLLLLEIRLPTGAADGRLIGLVEMSIRALIGGLLVGLLEETFFRGALYSAMRRSGGAGSAILWSSFLFTLVHFMKPHALPEGVLFDWFGTWQMSVRVFTDAFQWGHLDSMAALFLVGVFLGLVRERSGHIGWCLGLHAGWIFVIQVTRRLTDVHPSPDAPLVWLVGDYDGVIGWLAAGWIGLLALGLQSLTRNRNWKRLRSPHPQGKQPAPRSGRLSILPAGRASGWTDPRSTGQYWRPETTCWSKRNPYTFALQRKQACPIGGLKMTEITRLSTTDRNFEQRLAALLAWESVSDAEVRERVDAIIKAVREGGDAALLDYTRRLDRWQPRTATELEIPTARTEQVWNRVSAVERAALDLAAKRLRDYAEHQKLADWSFRDDQGTLLGQKATPLDRVGLYVPGGKAAYPSSVLMNAIPAKVAGVAELIMVVPTPAGELNDLVLAAARIAGVDRVFAIGGAQAVAALAYGTERVPAVDKIVGPGNIYVATAKRAVFGQVGIDMVAGPSEILVLCDGGTDPDWIAMDLFSQAEHDEDAQAILLSWDGEFPDRVMAAIDRLLPTMKRRDVIAAALRRRGALIQSRDLEEAIRIVNRIAPEHLELSVEHPEALVPEIRHAGAIFMGRYTAEVLGDYCAGPNHVLPTSRTARFSSPLGVYDFQKRSSLIMASAQGAATLARTASVLARGEGLTAHARSAEYRGDSRHRR